MPRPMMTPGGLALAPGTRLPDSWKRSGETRDAGNRLVTPADIAFRTTPNRDTREHAEKAFAISTTIGGMPSTLVGAGVEWTEDLKDQARRLHEDEVKYARQRKAQAAERARAKMEHWMARIDAKVASFKANPVTTNNFSHTKSTEKGLY